jgi:iron(III) transport system permease protein
MSWKINQPNNSNSENTSSNRKVFRRIIGQRSTAEDWIRRFLIFLICAWLFVGVVLPLYQVILRSLYAELPVAIFGKDDIRIAGHRVLIKENEVLIDDETVLSSSYGKAELDGIIVDISDNKVRVESRKAIFDGKDISVSPISVLIDGEDWWIDGYKLSEEEWQKPVGRFIGLRNFVTYFGNRGLYATAYNSLFIALLTTLIAVTLAFLYAYGLTRTNITGKAFFRVIAMIPLFAPTMLYGLSLVYLFGNKGVITTGFFQRLPWLALDINLYGPVGIVIAEVVFTFPAALIILVVSLRNTDARLYEAAISLGSSRLRTFFTVTLPGVKYGLISAIFVCFTLSFTDFGAPKVVGGNYSVLSVDIYKQVIGQQNFGMGATVSIILLIPTVIAFIVDHIIQRRQVAAVTSRSVPLVPKRNMPVDMTMFVICSIIAGFIMLMVFMAGVASLIKMWPYNFKLGFQHYTFRDTGGGGYSSYWNSVRMSFYTAIFGVIITFFSAYLIEKSKGLKLFRKMAYFLSILPLALPGLVIGIAYIFFFNKPTITIPIFGFEFRNPFNAIYGTMAILVISNIVHFYTVSFLTATTALRQIDKEFETVSESMSVPFYRTFFRVTVPVCFPAIIEIASYYFVSAMATVSALIFLYSPDTRVASVAVVNMDDAGDTAPAAAMCMLIVITNIAVRGIFEFVNYLLKKKTQAWRMK